MTYRPLRWGVAALAATTVGVLLDVVIQNQPSDAWWIPWIQRFWLPACIVLVVLVVAIDLLRSRIQTSSAAGESRQTGGLMTMHELPVTESEHSAARSRLIHQVRRTWVDGVLARSLDRVVPIELDLVEQPAAVRHVWRTVVRQLGEPDRPLPSGTSLKTATASVGTQLLVLGEPGAGKTTMLLEYARDLLEEADKQPDASIPVVLHLSFWPFGPSRKPDPLDAWLISELAIRYGLSDRVAKDWITRNRLALLLDGLDEVPDKRRTACIKSINTFRDSHGQMPLVVCSRTRDYEQIADASGDEADGRLTMDTALVVQPLTDEQIYLWLDAAGDHLTGLRIALSNDALLLELMSTPLLLNLAVLVYADQPVKQMTAAVGGIAAKRRQLLTDYVTAALSRSRHVLAQSGKQSYPIAATVGWLTALAQRMQKLGGSVFYPDELYRSWLFAHERAQVNRSTRWIRWGLALLFGIVAGLIFGLLGGASVGALAGIGVAWAGIAVGSIISDSRIRRGDALGWSWIAALGDGVPKGIFAALFTLLLGWLLTGAISWLLTGVTMVDLINLSKMQPVDPHSAEMIRRLSMELNAHARPTYGVLVALVSLGWTIFRFGLSTRETEAAQAPVLSIRAALRTGLNGGLLAGGIACLLVVLLEWVVGGLAGGVVTGLIFAQTVAFGVGFGVAVVVALSANLLGNVLGGIIGALAAGLIVGLHVGLTTGGSAYLRQKLARRRLQKAKVIPRNLLGFLSFAEDRLLLRRAGSGYLFIHQLLLERFAEGDLPSTISSSLPNVGRAAPT